MSILVNPDDPTPKNSYLTPDVRSQAYFLPSPAATGRTSFDDCKQTDVTPLMPIPGLRPGDLIEYKSPGWSWIIFNDWTTGFKDFAEQVSNQNAAIVLEGKGRQMYYCMGDQATAIEAARLYGAEYRSSHFLVCH